MAEAPLPRQPECPVCGHEHHLLACDFCDCDVRDPFGVIEEY